MSGLKVGQTVETSTGQVGIIKYVGAIHVAEGDWLGLELPTPTGKNDGSVRGERYFSCPAGHGLFIKESNIVQIISQPAPPPPKTPAKPTSAALPKAAPRPRPSSVIAPKPAPRTSTIAKRQSVGAAPTNPVARAPLRKASISGSVSTSASHTASKTPSVGPRSSAATSSASASASASASTAPKTSRDPSVETLQTKIRHLEKQHAEDQERINELSSAKDERDRYKSIIDKLQGKCQTLHQDATEYKTKCQQLQTEIDDNARKQEEQEADWEIALLDKEMAEERAEQAESELEALRAKMEEREMELEIMQEEAAMFTTELSEEEKQAAGWYRLQHENERLRQALVALKEMTEEKERDTKGRISELESDLSVLDTLRQEHEALQDRVRQDEGIIEHLRAQVDAGAEWEDISNELTNKVQELEDRVTAQESTIRELESEAELNNELLVVHMDEEEDLHAELDAKDAEIAEHIQRLALQEATIIENETLISKFRDLVFEFQGRLADAESSRNMTEAQVKDTTGKFNQVMDLNRRLRASNVEATSRRITSELRQLRADEASQQLAILKQTGSEEFLGSTAMQAYFTTKRVSSKALLASTLFLNTDTELSYNGGLDEATSRLACVSAVQYLTTIQSGADHLRSAIEASELESFALFGPTNEELLAIEKTLDDALSALMADDVKFADISGSLQRSTKVQEAILAVRQEALLSVPESEAAARVQRIVARVEFLGNVFTVMNTMLSFLANNASELLAQNSSDEVDAETMVTAVEAILERFAVPSVICSKVVAAGQKLMRTVDALRHDSLYPHILKDSLEVLEQDNMLCALANEAAEWGRNTLSMVSASFQPEASPSWSELDLDAMFGSHWRSPLKALETTAQRLEAWTEDASLLQNTSEIAHGPTPWSQKAQEMEAAKKKTSEAGVLLEKLKADHTATLRVLHEREQVIETKSLEIEHLDAKFRDATNKVTDAQQLRDKLVQAEQELTDLRNEIHDQHAKIQSLEQHVANTDQSDQSTNLPETTKPVAEAIEQPSAARPLPAQINCLLSALQTENHWLRRREHADMFNRNLKHAFGQMQQSQGKTRALSSHHIMAEALLDDDEDASPTPALKQGTSRNKNTAQELGVVPSPQTAFYHDVDGVASFLTTVPRHKMSPLSLHSIQTAWQPAAETPEWIFEAMQNKFDYERELYTMCKEEEDEAIFLDDEESSVLENLTSQMA
ncbi:hypothetical protein ACEQ8H_003138 [Pleosporales sp. CAS-2024a]